VQLINMMHDQRDRLMKKTFDRIDLITALAGIVSSYQNSNLTSIDFKLGLEPWTVKKKAHGSRTPLSICYNRWTRQLP
jgi:hypothetical protein